MGRLIIDGNSVFELDENCLKNKEVSKHCDVEKYLKDNYTNTEYREERRKKIRRR